LCLARHPFGDLDPRGECVVALVGRRVRAEATRRRDHRGLLPPAAGPDGPGDRHAQAQGREDPHRDRAARSQDLCGNELVAVRILLFTGKGGVGKSTTAAGTAALAASRGLRTLVLSTDAAHSLADAYGVTEGLTGHGAAEPTQIADNLFLQQVDAQLRFEQSWADIQRYLLSVLDVVGVDPVAAEELTVIPGAEEV